MRKVTGFLLLLILGAVSITLCMAATSNTNTPDNNETTLRHISPGDDIQKTIDSLDDGGKLVLSEGTYDTPDAVVLEGRKNLTIEGIGEVWINTKGIDHHVITLKGCKNITLSNIKAQHIILEEGDNAPVDDARDGAVIGIIEGSGINIVNCELVGCGIYGVYAYSATPVLLDGCYLHDNSKSAVLFAAGAKPMNVVIRDCIITKNAASIEVKGDITIKKEGYNRIERNSPNDYQRQEETGSNLNLSENRRWVP